MLVSDLKRARLAGLVMLVEKMECLDGVSRARKALNRDQVDCFSSRHLQGGCSCVSYCTESQFVGAYPGDNNRPALWNSDFGIIVFNGFVLRSDSIGNKCRKGV